MDLILERDLNDIPNKQLYIFGNDNVDSLFLQVNNDKTPYETLIIKRLNITIKREDDENPGIKYSLVSNTSKLFYAILELKIENIKIDNPDYSIRFKKDFVENVINYIDCIYNNRTLQRYDMNALKIFFNFFDKTITKKEYFKFLGRNVSQEYSNELKETKISVRLPFFFSYNTTNSFPHHFTPKEEIFFELNMNHDILSIIDIIDKDGNEINSLEDIKINISRVKEPDIVNLYCSVTEAEKSFPIPTVCRFKNLSQITIFTDEDSVKGTSYFNF